MSVSSNAERGPQSRLAPRSGDCLVVGAPGAAPMARQAERRHQHQVESQVETREIGVLDQKGFGGAGDPSALAPPQRRRRRGELAPRLDLDDREHAAAAGQNVDLAGRASPPSSKNTPATQAQVPKT